jgi:protoheme IX farnesyltransferase
VTGHFDMAVLLLFFILVFWQMPHFYAIAMYRQQEYASADIPVLPIKKGIRHTKISMLIYTIAFVIASLLLTIFGYTSWVYFVLMALFGLRWMWIAISGLKVRDDIKWARRMFRFSLIVLLAFSILVTLDSVIR